MASSFPKKVGGYTIERRLGRGGMGDVLLGTHEILGRQAAIKRLLKPDPEAGGESADIVEARFHREGQLLAGLHHQGICSVYDLVHWRKTPYLVLEYIDGYDLSFLLKKNGAMPVDVALMVALEVADALQHAHQHGVLHRDIKPANVMISRKGEVKLMDFGIATAANHGDLTKTGLVVGTPNYLAPEVLKGGDPSPRSDLYALGVMLYRCLSGKSAFGSRKDPEQLYANILRGESRSLRQVAAHVPRKLARLVHAIFHKNPKKRPRDAAQLAVVLEAFLKSMGAEANRTERLVAYLHKDGHLSEEEALTVVAEPARLEKLEAAPAPPARPTRWLAAAVVFVAVTAATAWAVSSGAVPMP